MPSVRIIYDEPGWAFHHQALAMDKYAPADISVTLSGLSRNGPLDEAVGESPIDIIFYMPFRRVAEFRALVARRGWTPLFVGYWSTGWPHLHELFDAYYAAVDAVVCNNVETGRHYAEGPGVYTISNGVDLEIFNVKVPLSARRHKVLWTGSEGHRRVKGYDDFVAPLANELAALEIDCELRLVDSFGESKLTVEQMAAWYNSGTILVCASETEGTPNPALEAAACGCTVVSTPVGNMPELIVDGANGYLVERRVEALKQGVLSARDNYPRLAARMQQDIAGWHWRDRVASYFDLFRRLRASTAGPLP